MRIKTNAYIPPAHKAYTLGLIAEYLFDNVVGNIAPDTSGNEQHLTLYNTQIVEGKIGKCAFFSGVGTSYAEAPSGVIPGDGPLSFSIWVRRDNPVNLVSAIFCNKSGSTANPGVQFYVSAKTNTTVGVTPSTLSLITWEMPYGVWCHVAFTYDGATGGVGRLYLDGVLTQEAAVNGTRGEGMHNLLIGKRPDSAWLGYVDNLRFYDRELTAEEVSRLYQEGGAT